MLCEQVTEECALHTLPWPAVALQNWPQFSDPMILESWGQRTNISWKANPHCPGFMSCCGAALPSHPAKFTSQIHCLSPHGCVSEAKINPLEAHPELS